MESYGIDGYGFSAVAMFCQMTATPQQQRQQLLALAGALRSVYPACALPVSKTTTFTIAVAGAGALATPHALLLAFTLPLESPSAAITMLLNPRSVNFLAYIIYCRKSSWKNVLVQPLW